MLQLINEASNGGDPAPVAARVFHAYLDERERVGAPYSDVSESQSDAANAVVLRSGTWLAARRAVQATLHQRRRRQTFTVGEHDELLATARAHWRAGTGV